MAGIVLLCLLVYLNLLAQCPGTSQTLYLLNEKTSVSFFLWLPIEKVVSIQKWAYKFTSNMNQVTATWKTMRLYKQESDE